MRARPDSAISLFYIGFARRRPAMARAARLAFRQSGGGLSIWRSEREHRERHECQRDRTDETARNRLSSLMALHQNEIKMRGRSPRRAGRDILLGQAQDLCGDAPRVADAMVRHGTII